MPVLISPILAQVARLSDTPGGPDSGIGRLIEHYTLESSWPLALLLIVLPLVATQFLKTKVSPLKLLALVIGGLAAGLMLIVVSGFITTDHERLARSTDRLIELVATPKDTLNFGLPVDDHIRIIVPRGIPYSPSTSTVSPREALEKDIQHWLHERYPLESYKIAELNTRIDAPGVARSQVHVRVRPRQKLVYDVPFGSWWIINWKDTPSGWRATTIELQQLDRFGNTP